MESNVWRKGFIFFQQELIGCSRSVDAVYFIVVHVKRNVSDSLFSPPGCSDLIPSQRRFM